MPPSQIPERHHRTLELYRTTLPANEYAALEAWLTTFYPFQLDWLLDDSRFAVCNKSRQIGMSHTTAAWGVLRGAFHGETTTIISIGQDESNEVLDKAKAHREVLVALGSRMAGKRDKDNASCIDFASGGRVKALPSSGGRGFTGNMFLDEFAYHQHPKKVWDAALAIVMQGFMARVASTPNGVGNEFHGLWSNPEQSRGWSRHEISLERAIADGMRVDISDCWKIAKGDPRLYDQIFGCKFLDNEAQYIPTESIESCSVEDLYTIQGDYYAGLDIGRTADLTAMVVVRKVPDGTRWVQHVETCKRTDSRELEALVARTFQRFQPRRLCVDSTGMGAFPADEMQRRYGRHRVEPFPFTMQSKEDLATSLFSAFVEKTVRIPRADVKLREDLCSIRRVITTAGNVRYDAPHTDEGHADRAWALALALHGCNEPANRRNIVSGH